MIKLFAHRGFTKDGAFAENSIDSLKSAHKLGFRNIEFDVWFLNSKLVLKHNKPESHEIEILPNLQDYFCFKNEINYWIDFKNLDEKNVEEALEITKQAIYNSGINLHNIFFAPFITNYKKAEIIFAKLHKFFGKEAKIVVVCEELKSEIEIKNLRQFLSKNSIKYLSIFHKLIDQKLVDILNNIEIFAWTVNDLTTLRNLENIGVRNFATDKITPELIA